MGAARLPGLEKLCAGGDQNGAGSAEHREPGDPLGRQQAQMPGFQTRPFADQAGARLDIFTGHDHILSGKAGEGNKSFALGRRHVFLLYDRIRLCGERRAGKNADGLPPTEPGQRSAAGRRSADDAQPAGRVLRAAGVAVKGAFVKGRHGEPGEAVFRQNAVKGIGKGDGFCLGRKREALKQLPCFLRFNMLFHSLPPF